MTELRERLARAICDAIGDDWEREGVEGLHEAYAPVADAVLAEIAAAGYVVAPKEPTEAMVIAGDISMKPPGRRTQLSTLQAKVDALTAEPTHDEAQRAYAAMAADRRVANPVERLKRALTAFLRARGGVDNSV